MGFQNSLFYCEPLAALITQQGRQVLLHAVDIATLQCEKEIIYGDTDSLLMYTNETDLKKALDIGYVLRDKINEVYEILEIDIDDVFVKLLLLKKKRYAALKLNLHDNTTVQEFKGLEIVRRDWCLFAKKVNKVIINYLFSDEFQNKTELIQKIYEYLKTVPTLIRESKEIEDFIITRTLTKAIKDYSANLVATPHAYLAQRMMDRGMIVNIKDSIPYVRTVNNCNPNSDPESNYLGEYIEHPSFVTNISTIIDYNWYLESQVFKTLKRLCEPIHEIKSEELALCLGIQKGGNGNNNNTSSNNDDNIHLFITCSHCDHKENDILLRNTCIDCTNVFTNEEIIKQIPIQNTKENYLLLIKYENVFSTTNVSIHNYILTQLTQNNSHYVSKQLFY